MTILEIYQKYNIPSNLEQHMVRVCKVALFISSHWQDSKLDLEKLKIVCLLHDLGNIVKFDLDNHPELLGPEHGRIEYWRKVKQEIISKYGADDHEAAINMMREAGVGEDIIQIIGQKSFSRALETEKSDNWILKILFYSDLRSGPFEVMPLRTRLDEALARLEKYKNMANLKDLYQACLNLEQQIQIQTNFDLNLLTEDSLVDIKSGDLLNLPI